MKVTGSFSVYLGLSFLEQYVKMKRILFFAFCILLAVVAGYYAKRRFYDPGQRLAAAAKQVAELSREDQVKEGDLIFQTSLSAQSMAIQLATHSEFSHCGIIQKKGDGLVVFEAVEPVKSTPLDKWIARGKNGHFVIKRLRNAGKVLTPQALQKMEQIEKTFTGRHYDKYFEWSDERIYCSELIWKVYKEALGIEVGKLEKLRDFDLTNEKVKAKMKERYGDKIPLEETVISPVSIYNSELLRTVGSN